jgi:hypothetical protein
MSIHSPNSSTPVQSPDHPVDNPETPASYPVTTDIQPGDTVRLTLFDESPHGPQTATVHAVPETSRHIGGHVVVTRQNWDEPRDALLENVELV